MAAAELIKSKLPAAKTERWKYPPWTFESTQSHIMNSMCSTAQSCQSAEEDQLCDVCRYSKILGDRKLPDMIYSQNKLRIMFCNSGGIEFTALAALQQLRERETENIQVAHAKEWREARKDCEHSHNVKDDYDWTYTTDYTGTLLGDFSYQPSNQRIDINKLKVKEPIRFFQELYLFEDELDDNGATNCVVKIRCMQSGFLVLFRHYLRVDHVLVRLMETRFYHETGTDHIIRERVCKSKSLASCDIHPSVYKCPDQVSQLLDTTREEVDKIKVPGLITAADARADMLHMGGFR